VLGVLPLCAHYFAVPPLRLANLDLYEHVVFSTYTHTHTHTTNHLYTCTLIHMHNHPFLAPAHMQLSERICVFVLRYTTSNIHKSAYTRTLHSFLAPAHMHTCSCPSSPVCLCCVRYTTSNIHTNAYTCALHSFLAPAHVQLSKQSCVFVLR
jgi:hypothetical protein